MIVNILLILWSDYYLMEKETGDRRIMLLLWAVHYGGKLRILAPWVSLGRKVPARQVGGRFSLHTRPWLVASEGPELARSTHSPTVYNIIR